MRKNLSLHFSFIVSLLSFFLVSSCTPDYILNQDYPNSPEIPFIPTDPTNPEEPSNPEEPVGGNPVNNSTVSIVDNGHNSYQFTEHISKGWKEGNVYYFEIRKQFNTILYVTMTTQSITTSGFSDNLSIRIVVPDDKTYTSIFDQGVIEFQNIQEIETAEGIKVTGVIQFSGQFNKWEGASLVENESFNVAGRLIFE